MNNSNRIILCPWFKHKCSTKGLDVVRGFHESQGETVDRVHLNNTDNIVQEVRKDPPRFLYIWNGEYAACDKVKQVCAEVGTTMIFCELAWFPQGDFIYFDQEGTNGRSSLFTHPLNWLEDEDFDNMHILAENYKQGKKVKEGDYVLVPLQLPGDTSLKLGSPYKWMGKFIQDTRRRLAGERLIFRIHPKDKKTYRDLGVDDSGAGDKLDMILGSKYVYGINSTLLLESSLLGKPVTAIGKCFLSIGEGREEALAALVARQIPYKTCSDITPWIRRGRGLEHLAAYS